MKTKENTFIKNFRIALILTLLAVACVYVCSAHATYHALNFDSNFGYHMGVAYAIQNGAVPYKDIFTQLGPIALLLYTLTAIASNFKLILLLQIICANLLLVSLFRIAKRFLNTATSLLATALTAVLIYTSSAYVTGGMIEEFLLPLYAYLILSLIEFALDKKQFSTIRSISVSISLMLIVWTKFNLIVFPILFLMAYIAISIRNKQVKSMSLHLLAFVFVGVIVSMCMVWYLYINKCLNYFADCYFVFGLNAKYSLLNMLKNLFVILIAIAGIVIIAINHRIDLIELAIISGLYMLSLIFTATEIVNVLPFGVIASLGVVFSLELFEKTNILNRTKKVAKFATCIILVMYCIVFSTSFWQINNEKTNVAQNEIVEDIVSYEIENPTLLCYKTENYGLFNNTGINIGTRVFAENNVLVDFNELRLEFDNAMFNKETDFILMEESIYNTNKKKISENYDKVDNYTIYNVENFRTTKVDVVLLKVK